MTKKCSEDTVILHDLKWTAPTGCVDGGILRAKNTYVNLATSGFKTPIGYSGHFYGIRKYDGLIPNAPYSIIIEGKTGSGGAIKTPSQFLEVEYGSDDFVNYSGYTFPTNSQRYGKSISAKQNYIAIGSPFDTINYTELDNSGNTVTFNLDKTGSVHVYRREDRPSGYDWPENKHKSSWILDDIVTLPSGFIKDFYNVRYKDRIGGIQMPLPIEERFWFVGQEGREFGHSVDLAITNSGEPSMGEEDRKIMVVGAPSCSWKHRTFEELSSSGVQIGLMIFTDEFVPTIAYRNRFNTISIKSHTDIQSAIKNKDLIFQYFSDPPVKFDAKLIVCEPIADFSSRKLEDFPEPKPNYITKKRISRNQGRITEERTNLIFNDIKNAFHEAFPYDPTKLHNNIPVILGIYVDQSASLGKEAVSPALDRFISYFGEYSFASGLRDFYGVQSSGQCVEFVVEDSEDWIDNSINILNHVLDTGRLVRENQVRFFTSGVGLEAFNTNLSQFNYPPPSGGSVFIFEKENGEWNCIQEIASPNIIYDTPDRFGHAVSISDNTEVIVIGSPYISQSCQIYEYKKQEKNTLYSTLHSWLYNKSALTGGNNLRYVSLISSHQELVSSVGLISANKFLYASMTSTEKLEARKFLGINEYQLSLTYGGEPVILSNNTNARRDGNAYDWKFIIDTFAPTPRLGYSVATNDNGNIVAIGAPTDSFNLGDDARVYYKNLGYNGPSLSTSNISPSWKSHVNAGAVRVLESRKYYPHNRVIEFGKFGNLQEDINDPPDSGHFGYLSSIFRDKNFIKTSFDEVSIPQDAGLAFIITPAIDALSEEVLDNISSWLALGDRNLVLVGNDPIWEQGGIYAQSNEIINKILAHLKSRMILVPARNSFEALSSTDQCGKVIPSFIPSRSTSSYIIPQTLNAFGVADIRMNLENKNFKRYMPCEDSGDSAFNDVADKSPANFKCELPLQHMGDLRAEWLQKCLNAQLKTVLYPVNWAYLFNTHKVSECITSVAPIFGDFPNQEPVPLLAAATTITETVNIPGSPERFVERAIFKDYTITQSSEYSFFDSDNIASEASILWDSNSSNYTELLYNIDSSNSPQKFYTPDIFEERQSLLQARGIPMQEVISGQELVSEQSHFAIEENVFNNSKIICIAGLELETQRSLYSESSDKNLYFYINLVSQPFKRGESRIAQLGGWTGRSNFTDANPDSILYEVFINSNNDVELDVTTLSPSHNVCWIADPSGLPSDAELQFLLSWLRLPNKKLIVTYSNSAGQARLIQTLMSMLNSNITPLYLEADEKFASSNMVGPLFSGAPRINLNTNSNVSIGYDRRSKIEAINANFDFIPLKLVDGLFSIAFTNKPIYQTKLFNAGYWKFDSGLVKVTFPAIPNSGYRLFFTNISESPSEIEPISIYIGNVTRTYNLPANPEDLRSRFTENGLKMDNICIQDELRTSSINKERIRFFDVQAVSDNIVIYFHSFKNRLDYTVENFVPKTTRLLSVSGVLAPIVKTRSSRDITIRKFDRFETVKVAEAIPPTSFSQTRFTYISNKNDQYCNGEKCFENNLNNQLIADGPVVLAQELEHFSSFEAGMNRSRITLISDSSLVQGRCMGDEFYRASSESVIFLRSLYPESPFIGFNSGRNFNTITKLISPERGSPQKYFGINNQSGINNLFNGGYTYTSQASPSSFNDLESQYDPKYVVDPEGPYGLLATEQEKIQKRSTEINKFLVLQGNAGATAKFSGIIDGTMYADAGYFGGMPTLLKERGYDYLDIDKFSNSYKGDLFGYSLSISDDKIIVGSPGSAFNNNVVANWTYHVNNSGLTVGYDGGAGSVYIFEKTFNGSGYHGLKTAWECTQKLRPQSLQVGISGSASDKFGSSLDMASDIIAVGAPYHDNGNLYYNGSGNFIRKSFNEEFEIPSRVVTESSSGIQNRGSVYLFENSIVDWSTKTQKWSFIEKLTPEIFGKGQQDGLFGSCVSLDRSRRTDADYTLLISSFQNSGECYTCDIMLREQYPSIQHPDAYIHGRVFGEIDQNWYPNVFLEVKNGQTNNTSYYASGIVYTDKRGQIFLEASGQDPVSKGFIQHRPFIKSVNGQYAYGTPNSGIMSLYVLSNNPPEAENMNIFTQVDDSAIVYNNIGMFTGAVQDIVSNGPSGLYLYTDCPDPVIVSNSGLSLYTASGIGSTNQSLNMRIRGK